MIGRFSFCVSFFTSVLLSGSLWAANDADNATLVATVGAERIELAEVKAMMDLAFRDKKPTGDALPVAQAQVLQEVVNRRLMIAYARRAGDVPAADELAKAKKQLRLRLAAQGRAVAEADLDRDVLWRLTWDRYLARYITPERRKAWFATHHRDVDGTQLAVSHILLQPASKDDPQEIASLEKKAAAIRAEITAGKLSFAEAATKHSSGPSRNNGGRLGKIGRHGPMEETFSRAAFALEAGQISPPVRSPFGVHLIRCDEVAAGTKQISDVKETIDAALAQELLTKLSALEREKTAVACTDAWPHFKPGTQELAK